MELKDISLSALDGTNNKCHEVKIGGITLWFSYETIVAYEDEEGNLLVSENYWSNTTGRHLNAIAL